MRIIIKKLNILLLCAVMIASFALPVFAESADEYAILNLHYLPGGSVPRQPVTFNVYLVAVPQTDAEGNVSYALGEGYEGEELQALVDALNDQLFFSDDPTYGRYEQAYDYTDEDAAQVRYGLDYDTVKDWVAAFGGYINNSVVNNTATENTTMATKSAETDENGYAKLTGLDEGIYLVASNNVYNGYVAAPFIIQMPYVDEAGVINNYVTANLKWFVPRTYIPEPETEEPVEEPQEDPTEPTDTTEPVDTTEPEELEDLDELEILDEEVPLADLPDDSEPEIELEDEPVPLANLPQTGLLWWPVPVLGIAGVSLFTVGAVKRKNG